MTLIEERRTIGDKYAEATHATNLTPSTRNLTDADVLLAAGIAASGNERLRIALSAYRMRVNGDMAGLYEVAQQMDAWLNGRLHVKGNRPLGRVARQALIVKTLQWWVAPTCVFCSGHGFLPDEEAPRLTMVTCSACYGKGERPLEREVPNHLKEHAHWMVDQLNSRVKTIHERMARLLSQRMDEALR